MVITALEDADGSITLPLSFPLKNGRFDTDDIISSGTDAFLPIVATGIASLPLKLMNLGSDKERVVERPVAITFAPGSSVLDPAAAAGLEPLVRKLRDNPSLEVLLQHTLGDGDVPRARLRANPTRQDSLSILAHLREKKRELLDLRAVAAGEARSFLASRFDAVPADAALDRVRALDHEVAQTDDAIDAICDLLAPGADRRADRRTRAAAIDLGTARMEILRAALLATNIPDIAHRIRIVHAKFNPPTPPVPSTTAPEVSAPTPTGGQVSLTLSKVEKK